MYFSGTRPSRRRRVRRLARLQLGLRPGEKVLIELRERLQIGPRGLRRHVAVDDRLDVLDAAMRLVQGVGDVEHAAAVARVNQRQSLVREDVAGVHGSQRREHDERVAIRMPGPEEVQVDLIGALADRQPVGERALHHAAIGVLGKDLHLLHVGLRVRVRDDVSGGRELHVATHVIAVCMGVDEERHRFGRQLLDLVENRLAPTRVLRVDDGDAVGGDEHGGVAATAAQDVEAVVQFLDLYGACLSLASLARRGHAD